MGIYYFLAWQNSESQHLITLGFFFNIKPVLFCATLPLQGTPTVVFGLSSATAVRGSPARAKQCKKHKEFSCKHIFISWYFHYFLWVATPVDTRPVNWPFIWYSIHQNLKNVCDNNEANAYKSNINFLWNFK